MKRITNVSSGPRAIQYLKGTGKDAVPVNVSFNEGGTKGATVEVDDAAWTSMQGSRAVKAMLEGPDFQVV